MKPGNSNWLITAFTVYFVLLSPFSGRVDGSDTGNDKPDAVENIPTIVITATRDERIPILTPYFISVLNGNAIMTEKSSRTVPEALKTETGTMIQKTSHGQGSPYIRGFTGYRNLFMIDGIRLNNSVFRDGPNQYWNTVDHFSLHRLELARGPFSVLYGSDAVGGTVNAITRGVQDIRIDHRWDRRLYYRYSGAEHSSLVRAESISKLTDRLTMTLGYSFKQMGDVEGGRDVGIQKKTGYDERDWDAKLEYWVGDNSYFVLSHQSVVMDDAWRTHKTIYGINWEGLTVEKELRHVYDQGRELTYLQYHQYDRPGVVKEIHTGVSRHLQTEDRDRLRSGDRHDLQGFDVQTLGAFFSLKSPTPIGNLIYGTEFYHDIIDSYALTLNPDGSVKSISVQGPVGDNASYDLLGIYLQDEIPIADRLNFIAGIRYEYAKADAKSVQNPETGEKISAKGDWNDVVGNVRAIYYLNENKSLNAFAGASQGFRAPNMSDLTRFDIARTSEIETPSPNLKPENYISYEIGLKAELPRLSSQISYFYTDIDGMIVRTPTGRIIDENFEVTKKNAGNGYIMGFEFYARYRVWRNLSAFGSMTWMEGKVDTYETSDAVLSEDYIDRLMPTTGRLGLHWFYTDKLWLEGSCIVADKANRLSRQDKLDTSRIPPGGTPGYTVFDLRAGWRFTNSLAISLAIENITDADYRTHGSGINEPGRNFILSGDWTF